MINKLKMSVIMVLLIFSSAFAGCTGTDTSTDISNDTTTNITTEVCDSTKDKLKIAFDVKDDMASDSLENPDRIADYLCEKLDMDVSIYDVGSTSIAIESLRFGNADIAMNLDGGPAWVAWNAYDLEVMAADTKSDGREYYDAHAWVLADSEIAAAHLDEDESTDPFSLLEGKTSCHTGWLKSAGMLMPMGYLIGNGYVNVKGDMNDTETLRTVINEYFDGSTGAGNPASIPNSGELYSGYDGAVECLSSGYGDVAFAKDSTINSYCNNENSTNNKDWCLSMDKYVALPKFGSSPSHSVMFNNQILDDSKEEKIRNALVDMHKDEKGLSILNEVLGTSQMVSTNASKHLGPYGLAVKNIPGISSKWGSAFEGGESTPKIKSTINIAYYIPEDTTSEEYASAQGLADRLSKQLGVNVNLYDVTSEGMIVQSLRFGQADIAFMEGGPAWIGWKEYGLDVLAVETTTIDKDTYYEAGAVVHKDSDIAAAYLDNDSTTDPFSLMKGKISCHTGWLKSAGMLMPMGYLIGNGYVTTTGDDIDSLRTTIETYFDGSTSSSTGTAPSIPDKGALYSGYGGALECLSTGYGDVAFVKVGKFSTVDSECNNEDSNDNENWCLDLSDYIELPAWGSSPSHPVMYNPERLDVHTRNAILNAMLSWNDETWVTEMNDDGTDICYNSLSHETTDDDQATCEAYAWYEDQSWGDTTYTGCYNMESHVTTDDDQATCEAYAYYENYGATINSTYCYNTITHQVDRTSPKAQCGDQIFNAATSKGYGLTAGNSQNHLGSYSSLLANIPGLSKYYQEDKYGFLDTGVVSN